MALARAEDDAVLSVLEDRRYDINQAIDEDLPIGEPRRLYEASRYLLDAGGKRLRPTITLLVAEALTNTEPGEEGYRGFPTMDGERIDIMKAAVSIEVIQSFTLIHDDIMDDDALRRGVPSVHEYFDLETAILAGDTLYSKAFEIMLGTGATPDRSMRAIRLLAETCTLICEGQALDIAFENAEDVTVESYDTMIERKTAVLFEAAAAVPAILLGADEQTVDALAAYGRTVGEAFQIHDDVLDLVTPSEILGKQQGSDLVEGKRTLITLHAQQHGIDISSINLHRGDADAIEQAVAELEAAGSIDFARDRAQSLVDEGLENLAAVPDGRSRALLTGLAYYLIEREY